MLPREKLVKYGVKYLEEYELLAIILGFGSNDENVFELSKRILASVSSVNNLLNLSYEDLIKIKGIKSAKATKIIASIELAKRIFSYRPNSYILDNPLEIYQMFRYDFINLKHEEFMVLFLDKRMRLIKSKMLSKGCSDIIFVDIKEVLNEAIKCESNNIILLHNHPSDILEPSKSDINTTLKIKEASNLLDINLIDHIIIGNSSYYSFVEKKKI